LEGGGVYAISRQVREGLAVELDLAPDLTVDEVARRITGQKTKDTVVNRLRKSLHLSPVKLALLMEFGRPLPEADRLARLVKQLPVRHSGLRPIEEAISTAGGVAWRAVDQDLMLKDRPGVFVAGEMLDWEAPTGGYLLTGCFATGRSAGQAAANWRPG
jgi:predicted flavoprotein YhiN